MFYIAAILRSLPLFVCFRRNSSRRYTSAFSVSSSRRFSCFSPKRSKINRSLGRTRMRYGGAWYVITQYTAKIVIKVKLKRWWNSSSLLWVQFLPFFSLPPQSSPSSSFPSSTSAASQKARLSIQLEDLGSKRFLCTQNPSYGVWKLRPYEHLFQQQHFMCIHLRYRWIFNNKWSSFLLHGVIR